jgi:hypothetical protein
MSNIPNTKLPNCCEVQAETEKKTDYFVRHSKQEMHHYNRELAECDGWDEEDMIYEENWKGEYHEVMFGPFDKTNAKLIFEKIKSIKNNHYSITQGEWEETSSVHGKKGLKRTTGTNYHNAGYYYEYLSIENPRKQVTNMSVDEWLEKMDMTECLDKGLSVSSDESSGNESSGNESSGNESSGDESSGNESSGDEEETNV